MNTIENQNLAAVTADQVAELAGVSRWTVTRAFKKDAPISDKSRKKVMAVAEKLGYVPDLSASSLASNKSNLVALLIDDFSNPHKLVMLERLTRILRLKGWGTLLVNMLDESDGPSALLSASQRRVDATVVIGTRFDANAVESALGAKRVKKLIVLARTSSHANTISISCDDDSAMSQIADHLFAKKIRRPLFLAGPNTQSAVLKRKSSFISKWKFLTGNTADVIHADDYDNETASDAVEVAFKKFTKDTIPDALVCENDVLAIGAMDALRYKLGLKIPQDIAVTGFDDIPLTASPSYNLTTYRQPITLMADALIEVLEGNETKEFIIPGQFVERGSS